MRSVPLALWALCLAAAASSVAADRRIIPDYKGFIRVQGGHFVDDNCNLFPVTGLNAYVASSCHGLAGHDACSVGQLCRSRKVKGLVVGRHLAPRPPNRKSNRSVAIAECRERLRGSSGIMRFSRLGTSCTFRHSTNLALASALGAGPTPSGRYFSERSKSVLDGTDIPEQQLRASSLKEWLGLR